jgi:hypothetical protein
VQSWPFLQFGVFEFDGAAAPSAELVTGVGLAPQEGLHG